MLYVYRYTKVCVCCARAVCDCDNTRTYFIHTRETTTTTKTKTLADGKVTSMIDTYDREGILESFLLPAPAPARKEQKDSAWDFSYKIM